MQHLEVSGAVRHIYVIRRLKVNIENDTTPYTADLQKTKLTNFYQMDKLWWELYNRECGEGLTDVKSEGADIEKVQCAGA